MFCTFCWRQVDAKDVTCGNCGNIRGASRRSSPATMPKPLVASSMPDHAAAALAYLTVIPAIILLVRERYHNRPFVCFHAFQSISLTVVGAAVMISLMVIPAMSLLLQPLFLVTFFVLWVVTIREAYSGNEFELPVIGVWARKQAETIERLLVPQDAHRIEAGGPGRR